MHAWVQLSSVAVRLGGVSFVCKDKIDSIKTSFVLEE